MKQLNNKSVYLSGPIDDVSDGGLPWRRKLKRELGHHFYMDVILPHDKQTYFPHTNWLPEEGNDLKKLRDNGEYDKLHKEVRKIRHADLRLVDLSDFIIAKLPKNVNSRGTHEEITLANQQKKPVLLWVDGGKQEAPIWFFGEIPHKTIFATQEEIIDYLIQIDHGHIDKANKGRWLL